MFAASSLLIWLIGIAASDIRHRRIPNWLVLIGAGLALAVLGLGWQLEGVNWSDALSGALGGFGVLLVFYALGWMGAADVKLAAVMGLWGGPWVLLWVWIGATLMAAAHSVALIAWRRLVGGVRAKRREVPFGAYMAFAMVTTLAVR